MNAGLNPVIPKILSLEQTEVLRLEKITKTLAAAIENVMF